MKNHNEKLTKIFLNKRLQKKKTAKVLGGLNTMTNMYKLLNKD
jgi:hypothetical protein